MSMVSSAVTIDNGINAVSNYLLDHMTAEGCLHGPCSSRPFETALALHLISDSDCMQGSAEGMRKFCSDSITQYDSKVDIGSPLGFNNLLNRLMADQVIENNSHRVNTDIETVLSSFNHHSGNRKKILFSIILAEIGVIPFASLDIGEDVFNIPGIHHWAGLGMLSAKIIYTCGIGKPNQVVDSDLKYLVQNQSPNGSWENHIFLTLLALIAIKKTGRFADALNSGCTFLEKQIGADGGIPFVPDVDIWITSMAGFIFSSYSQEKEITSVMASYIVSQQHVSGGWGFSEDVSRPDLDCTAMCTFFLHTHNATEFGDYVERGRRYLKQSQNLDGGFPTHRGGVQSEVEITAHALSALADDGRSFENILNASNWLAQNQQQDGTFSYEWTLSVYYPVSQVLQMLNHTQQLDDDNPLLVKSLAFMANSQNADGGWGSFPGWVSTVLATSYAVIGITACGGANSRAALERGVSFLLQQQLNTGGFKSPPDALGPRPLVYNVELYSSIYACWALLAGRQTLIQNKGDVRAEVAGVS